MQGWGWRPRSGGVVGLRRGSGGDAGEERRCWGLGSENRGWAGLGRWGGRWGREGREQVGLGQSGGRTDELPGAPRAGRDGRASCRIIRHRSQGGPAASGAAWRAPLTPLTLPPTVRRTRPTPTTCSHADISFSCGGHPRHPAVCAARERRLLAPALKNRLARAPQPQPRRHPVIYVVAGSSGGVVGAITANMQSGHGSTARLPLSDFSI